MSSYSEGQTHQLMDRLEEVGFTADEIRKLGQFPELSKIRDLVNCKAQIVYPERRWREENGVIYLTLVSNGMTGEQWIAHLEAKGYVVTKWAKDLLLSPEFKPTNGVVYNIAILKGELFADSDRVTKKIRKAADKRKFVTPHPEISCLIRDNFTDQEIREMGLTWIVGMHDAIRDPGGDLRLLAVGADDRRLGVGYDGPDYGWSRSDGFAFALPQV